MREGERSACVGRGTGVVNIYRTEIIFYDVQKMLAVSFGSYRYRWVRCLIKTYFFQLEAQVVQDHFNDTRLHVNNAFDNIFRDGKGQLRKYFA